ncbi:MAG: cytochrome c family protein [Alphaproteobacteria bacterium]|nr:cytochrome c family protein [Alphaproteobacteria bacterium]
MKKFVFPAAALAVGVMLSGGTALAAGDPAKGKQVYKKCAICHDIRKGKNKIGPSLFGVFGRKAAQAPGFRFSPAMKKSGLVWNEENLDKYLQNPRKTVKGTRMVFAGLRSKKDRENVIAYLKTLK